MVESRPEYEFTPAQNQLIRDLAWKMQVVGVITCILGILYFLIGIPLLNFVEWKGAKIVVTLILLFIHSVIYLTLGIWMRKAADSFGAVVTSQGNDIRHLMNGLDNLRKMFSLLCVLVVIGLIFLCTFVVFSISGTFSK